MKRISPLVCSLVGISLLPAAAVAVEYTIGKPNILWRAKINGENKLWYMNGSSFDSETSIMATGGPDHNWKIAGVGDFNGGGQADILWQHETADANAIWFMNGTSFGSAAMLPSTGDSNWRMAAVADFNRDGMADILWQHRVSNQVAVWLMNGTNPWYTALLSQQPDPSDPNWKVVGAGDFNNDGVPDLVWRHEIPGGPLAPPNQGLNAIWYLGGSLGLQFQSAAIVSNADQNRDWKICGAWDFNHDGKTDLLWRHTTLGADAVWFMNNYQLEGATYLKSWTDPAWKIATQDTSQSLWRQQWWYYESLSAAGNGSQITLNYKISQWAGNGVTVQRRVPPATAWQTLAGNWQPGALDGSFPDTSSQAGTLYEYKIFREGKPTHQRVMAGINVPAIESRGTLVLVVDSQIAPHMGTSLTTLKKDLIGDGWNVVEYSAPRHDDSNTSAANDNNRTNREAIKSFIVSQYTSNNAKGVFIVGHATIPYSGFSADDSHALPPNDDHQGAWTADMYYADVNGSWTDSSVNYTPSTFPENVNVIGDGKFDNDWSPSDLELFVGRIDFARLPSFGTGSSASSTEGMLIQRYIAKAHRYRTKESPVPVRELSITFGTVLGDNQEQPDNVHIYGQAIQNSSALFGTGLDKVFAGDPYFQERESYVFGFAGGKATWDRINTEFVEAGTLFLQHTSSQLAAGTIEGSVLFYELLGSWFGDWNMQDDFMRATTATPNYGLAATWSRYSNWRFFSLAMGLPLGQSLLSTANDIDDVSGRYRYLAIIGDPTLRLHTVAPPAGLDGDELSSTSVKLDWFPGEADCSYSVFRATSLTGTFQKLDSVGLNVLTFTDSDAPPASQRIYMVRAVKNVTSGSGSYQNVSRGSFWPDN